MKILLLAGHGKDGNNYDPGASGCGYTEAVETIKYAHKVADHLRAYAQVDVYDGNMYHYLFETGGIYDFTKYDYVLECHMNAFSDASANGTEIFVTTQEKMITVEQAIMKRLGKYFKLRDNDAIFDGVKRFNWGVINAIKNEDKVSCALLELCFITNASDMNVYLSNLDAICKDIALGIAEGFGLIENQPKPQPAPVPPSAPIAFKVPSTLPKGAKFWISDKATVYGGQSYGVPIPTFILNATTLYTSGGEMNQHGFKWVLANEIMSWVKVQDCLI